MIKAIRVRRTTAFEDKNIWLTGWFDALRSITAFGSIYKHIAIRVDSNVAVIDLW